MTQSLPAFTAPGRFWRGNLHTHSTRSDGVLEPEEVCRRYRAEGYDFLALTDHFVGRYGYPIVDTVPFRTQQLHHDPGGRAAFRGDGEWRACGTSSRSACPPISRRRTARTSSRSRGRRAGPELAARAVACRGLRRHRPSAMVGPDAGRRPVDHCGPCGRDLQPRLRRRLRPGGRLRHRRSAADRGAPAEPDRDR